MSEVLKEKNSAKETASKLTALYEQIPDWERILSFVQDGERKFVRDLEIKKLNSFGTDTSRVHSYSDIEVQAFILGIPSESNPEEVSAKSYLTYGAHWLDDFFDNPNIVINPEGMMTKRQDIKDVLESMNPVGQVGSLLAEKTSHPEGVYKGLHRMLYGGLVQRSLSQDERRILLDEYQTVGLQFVDPRVAGKIKSIQPEAYWTTNKTVQEFINAAENHLDFTVAELWNLIYAPALYYHDITEEEKAGESGFDEKEKPRPEEMLMMVKIGAEFLSQFPDERIGLRIKQLQFLLKAFKAILPSQIVSEYQAIVEKYK